MKTDFVGLGSMGDPMAANFAQEVISHMPRRSSL